VVGDPNRRRAWRIERLRAAGFSDQLANRLAADPGHDVHALLELIDRGCPPDLAARILTPMAPATAGERRGQMPRRGADMYSVGARGSWQGSSRAVRARRTSRLWVERLSATGATRDAALVELHVLLSRAARFEVSRRRLTGRGDDEDLADDDDLAHQSADQARVAILPELSTYDGESRFTTWACKFALHAAAAAMRRRAWGGREIPLEADRRQAIGEHRHRPAEPAVGSAATLAVLGESIEGELGRHEREVLVVLVLGEVPIDVLAEWLNTTRDALYRTVRTGRQKLRAALEARGLQDQLPAAAGTAAAAVTSRDRDRLIARLTGPSSVELGCDECFARLDFCVELELAGADADAAIPGMRAHFEGCSACAEDHRSLGALLVSDAAGGRSSAQPA
jgi:RNA polymerase sigma-70 factor (ECF subfamily)